MTKKKKDGIEQHKEEDLQLIRKACLAILKDNSTSGVTQTAKVKAGSLLARIHLGSKLGPDPTEEKLIKQKVTKPSVSAKHQQALKDILNQDV